MKQKREAPYSGGPGSLNPDLQRPKTKKKLTRVEVLDSPAQPEPTARGDSPDQTEKPKPRQQRTSSSEGDAIRRKGKPPLENSSILDLEDAAMPSPSSPNRRQEFATLSTSGVAWRHEEFTPPERPAYNRDLPPPPI